MSENKKLSFEDNLKAIVDSYQAAIQKLDDYEKDKADGKLVRLSLKIGETAYYFEPDWDHIYTITITEIHIDEDGIWYHGESLNKESCIEDFIFSETYIGLCYFLTEEEAVETRNRWKRDALITEYHIHSSIPKNVLYWPEKERNCIYPISIVKIQQQLLGGYIFTAEYQNENNEPIITFMFEDDSFGKQVFFSKEEAEKKLVHMVY